SRPDHRNAGARRARLSRLYQRLVHHGRHDRHRFARRFSAAGRSRSGFRQRANPDRIALLLPCRPRRARCTSGIRDTEWVVGGTVVEGTEAENGGRPIVMFSALPAKDVTLYDNWGGVTGLRGTGSCDFSVENYHLPEHFAFVWDVLQPKPRRGGPSYLLPPFSYVAKEHGSVAIGAARRALDELIKIATTTRGTFRSSKLDERHVVHRQIAEADLKIRSIRALMHERYDEIYEKVSA